MGDSARSAAEVETWLKQHGYAFEHATARGFRAAGFACFIARPYLDPIEDKVREIDVLALSTFQSAVRYDVSAGGTRPVSLRLAIECKARTVGAWLVRVSAPTTLADRQWRPIASPQLARDFDAKGVVVTGRMAVPDPLPFAVVEATKRSGANANPAFDAVRQAVSGAVAVAADLPDDAIVIPVVALETTPLFTVEYPGEEPNITPVSRARVLWRGAPLAGPTAVELISLVGADESPRVEMKELALTLRESLEDFFLETEERAPGVPFGASA